MKHCVNSNQRRMNGISIGTNVVFAIVLLVLILCMIYCALGMGILGDAGTSLFNKLENVNRDSVSAGYEVIIYLFSGMGSLVLMAFCLVLLIFCIPLAIWDTSILIYAFSLRRRLKRIEQMDLIQLKKFKLEGIHKSIYSGIYLAVMAFAMIEEKMDWQFGLVVLGVFAFFAICVYQAVLAHNEIKQNI